MVWKRAGATQYVQRGGRPWVAGLGCGRAARVKRPSSCVVRGGGGQGPRAAGGTSETTASASTPWVTAGQPERAVVVDAEESLPRHPPPPPVTPPHTLSFHWVAGTSRQRLCEVRARRCRRPPSPPPSPPHQPLFAPIGEHATGRRSSPPRRRPGTHSPTDGNKRSFVSILPPDGTATPPALPRTRHRHHLGRRSPQSPVRGGGGRQQQPSAPGRRQWR